VVEASQAASARLLATAAAGLAGLTAAAAAAEQADRAQRSAGATGQPRDKAVVDQRVMDRKAMYSLLQQGTNLAMSALDAASRMPGFAADFIEVPSLLRFALLLLRDCFGLLADTTANGVWSQPLWEACLTAQLGCVTPMAEAVSECCPVSVLDATAEYLLQPSTSSLLAAEWLRHTGWRGGGNWSSKEGRGPVAQRSHGPAAAAAPRRRPQACTHVPAGDPSRRW
jgi:hypothetical protein